MQASNYVQKGRVLSVVAPYTRTAGQAAMIGSILGVAYNDVTSGQAGDFDFEGVWNLAKTSAQAWTLGDKIYWNATTKLVSNVPTDGPLVGVAVAGATNPSSTGKVRLNGVPAAAVPATNVVGDQAAIADAAALTATTPGTGADATTPSGAEYAAVVADLAALRTKLNAILATLRTAGLISE